MPDIVDTRQFAAPFLATRMFVRPGFRAPDGMGAVAVIIFPRTAAAQPNRMRNACLAFVGVLGDSRQVIRSNPDVVQMVTLWPVKADAQLPMQAVLERNDPAAAAEICQKAAAAYDFDAAERWHYRLQPAARLGSDQGPLLAAWSPGRAVNTPHVQILRYDLTGVRNAENFVNAFKVWKEDIEQHPELWRDGWDATRIRIQMASRVDDVVSWLRGALRVDRSAATQPGGD
jgi:hypothetical protein